MSYLRPILLLAFALLASSLLLLCPVRSDEWQPVTPEELKMTSEPKAPGAPAIFLYRQVDRKDLGRGNTEYNYVRIKILTEEGRKYANIEIPYLRQQVAINGIRARTIRPDGSIANFDGQVYEQMLEKTGNRKIVAKTFTVPDVQVGSIVEYHFNYDFQDGYVFNSEWILSAGLFTKKALFTLKPYDRFPVRWSWPAGLPEGASKPEQGTHDGIVRMTARDVPAFQEEEYMPPENELKFRVNFVYNEMGFEEKEDKYWEKFGKKEYHRVDGFVSHGKAMEEAVGTIISPSDAPITKLQKIYDRCQQVRNLSYEPYKAGAEEKRDKFKMPDNVEELWKAGYGSGNDITWLFLGLARAAGFEAYPVMVASRSEYFFNPKRMDSHELEANLVVVKVDGKDAFYDPGSAFTPFGLLPWYESGVQGRRLDKDGGSWIETPLAPSAASRIERKAELKLDDEGELAGKVTVRYSGLEASSLRRAERNQDEAGRKKSLEDRLKQNIPASAEIELKNTPDWKSSNQPLVAEFDVKIPGWVTGAGKHVLLPTGLFTAAEKHMFEHASRTFPVIFDYTYQKVDDITISLPTGWQVSSTPKPVDKDAQAVAYKLSVDGANSTVHLQRTLRNDLYMVSADKYPALRSFYQLVRSADDQQVVLQPGAAAAKN